MTKHAREAAVPLHRAIAHDSRGLEPLADGYVR
jgi:hypothetical protein